MSSGPRCKAMTASGQCPFRTYSDDDIHWNPGDPIPALCPFHRGVSMDNRTPRLPTGAFRTHPRHFRSPVDWS